MFNKRLDLGHKKNSTDAQFKPVVSTEKNKSPLMINLLFAASSGYEINAPTKRSSDSEQNREDMMDIDEGNNTTPPDNDAYKKRKQR